MRSPRLRGFSRSRLKAFLSPHDELDIPVGTASASSRVAGIGGHNGLRDIFKPALGNNANFGRLRVGIGHPGHASRVTVIRTGCAFKKVDRER